MKKILIMLTIVFSSITLVAGTSPKEILTAFGVNSSSIKAYEETYKTNDSSKNQKSLLI